MLVAGITKSSTPGKNHKEGTMSSNTFEPQPLQVMTLSDSEYRAIRELVYKHFGINLTDRKRSLVVGRLQKLLRAKGFRSFRQYYEHILGDSSHRALQELANRISTNHTFFYRERAHFDFFTATVLPRLTSELKSLNSRDLRIWSAGCSTGEEPYTLIMLMMEYFGAEYRMWDAGILATDISEQALSTARNGIYPEERTALIPPALKHKYFVNPGNGELAIRDSVKREAVFRRFNLMNERFPFRKPFHVIFCRNVMIYFDQATRDALVRKLHEMTTPGGYLFIGHAETISRGTSLYRHIMPAVYRREW